MTGIHHIALRVQDCSVSARFYEQTFGLREIRRIESEDGLRAVWLAAGETVLMLELSLRGQGPAEGSGHVLVFPTSDLAAAEERFIALGVAVKDRTASTLYVSDPDGHRVGVSTFRFVETAS
jgi:catechol 2,3-dioxygenase-like lactoylglutathione lyase family enzyme